MPADSICPCVTPAYLGDFDIDFWVVSLDGSTKSDADQGRESGDLEEFHCGD